MRRPPLATRPFFTRHSWLVACHSPQVFDERLGEEPPPGDLGPSFSVRRAFWRAALLLGGRVAERATHLSRCDARGSIGRRPSLATRHAEVPPKLPQPFLGRLHGRAEHRQSTAIRRGNLRVQRNSVSLARKERASYERRDTKYEFRSGGFTRISYLVCRISELTQRAAYGMLSPG